PRPGPAGLVCDLVCSGATLLADRPRPAETIMRREAALLRRLQPVTDIRGGLAQMLLRRLDGVLRLRDSRLLMFQAQRSEVPALLEMLPDAEQPTVLQVDGGDTLALQALCHGAMTWQRLEDLKRAGARGLMVLP